MASPLTAIVVALFWSVVAALITWSRGYTPRAIVLCLLGIIAGGVLGYLPGAYALKSWSVVIGDDPAGVGKTFPVVALAAILVGALCGLLIAERLRDHAFPSGHQIIMAALGFLVGGMAGFVLVGLSWHTWGQSIAAFGLFPLTVGMSTLAGSAIAHRPIDDPP